MGQADTASVIPLTGQGAPHDPDPLAAVERYWQGLRATPHAPTGDVRLDPRGFSGALSDSFIAEAITASEIRICIAGQRLEALAGTPLRGLPLSVLFLPEARPTLARAVRRTLAGTPARLGLIASQGPFRPGLRAGLVLLPLGNGPCRRVLGALSAAQPPSRRACRFRIDMEKGPPGPAQPLLRIVQGGKAGT
ncbi:PAS domain-containing protein [Rhodovulum adriaticum]|uniref:PAS domain-containing protein n=1 Tax=Rhodovulum adriaticum TaxID=35804 RepID=A0A4V2SLF4_RHOAD|nr:PAS domain-containing protein [Rhodovulum adriaticum]MBK1634405.1 hypothetical protein [Rhodovulum adriaticum]TCP23226.1 PAS domain-containing protein [Rhodovulum adriaticum]